MENLTELKEIIATLNLESETTAEIINQLMPLLWWKFVWSDILWAVVMMITLLPLVFGFMSSMRTIND